MCWQKNVNHYLPSTALRIFQRAVFIAAQRILPFITLSRYPNPLLAAGFPSPSAQLFVRCVLEMHGGKE
jgi:hypothetical protein